MNQPEYILTDELATIAEAVKDALGLPVLNYQYGYITELNETLKQWEASPETYDQKYPLLWLEEPYDLSRGEVFIYGRARVNLFIIIGTEKTLKAKDRMEQNYKLVLFPIYRELLNQLAASQAFHVVDQDALRHAVTKGYYWGDNQKTVLNDAVDCLKIGALELPVAHRNECAQQETTFFTNA